MVVSSFTLDKEEINHKTIQSEKIDEENKYHFNMYFIEDQSALDEFYENEGSSIDDIEKKKYKTLDDNLSAVYFILDTPIGYQAYKRDNIQAEIKDQGLIMVTDNFYYYASKPSIFYCVIDLKEDSDITNQGTYSFFYLVSRKYSDKIKEENVRMMYKVTE